jgi:hypothetical protein
MPSSPTALSSDHRVAYPSRAYCAERLVRARARIARRSPLPTLLRGAATSGGSAAQPCRGGKAAGGTVCRARGNVDAHRSCRSQYGWTSGLV